MKSKTDNKVPFMSRLLAMMIDSFLLLTPITIFLGFIFGFDGLNDHNDYRVGLLQVVLYGTTTVLFWHISGQTPGKRAIGARVVRANSNENLSYLMAIVRFISYFLSLTTVIGILLPLLRKDRKALHDVISNSTVIFTKEYKNIMFNRDKYIKKKQ